MAVDITAIDSSRSIAGSNHNLSCLLSYNLTTDIVTANFSSIVGHNSTLGYYRDHSFVDDRFDYFSYTTWLMIDLFQINY